MSGPIGLRPGLEKTAKTPKTGRPERLFEKIHLLTDAHGNLLSATVKAGQQGEAPEFLNVMADADPSFSRKKQRPKAVAGDKAYSTHAIQTWLRSHQGIWDVIPRCSNERRTTRSAKQAYRQWNVAERLISKLKEYRRTATRYEKTKARYLAIIKDHHISAPRQSSLIHRI